MNAVAWRCDSAAGCVAAPLRRHDTVLLLDTPRARSAPPRATRCITRAPRIHAVSMAALLLRRQSNAELWPRWQSEETSALFATSMLLRASPPVRHIGCIPRRIMRGPAEGFASTRPSSTSAATATGLSALADVDVAGHLVAALLAVRRAAHLTTGAQGALITGTDTASKADASPVTVADYATQALVATSLASWHPEIPLLAEEDATELRLPSAAPQVARVTALVNATWTGKYGRSALSEAQVLDAIDRGACPGGRQGSFWVLDPIDGTKGFVAGRQYCIALALVRDGKPVLGVCGSPNLGPVGTDVCPPGTGVVFFAVAGRGAFSVPMAALDSAAAADVHASPKQLLSALETLPGASQLAVSASRPLNALRVAESSSDSACAAHGDTARVSAALGVDRSACKPVQMDSCAKYGVCARGEAELYLRFPPDTYREKVWDHAAGTILVEESGGKVTDCAGRPLDFGQGRYLDMAGGIVAAPAQHHAAVLEAVNKCIVRKSMSSTH